MAVGCRRLAGVVNRDDVGMRERSDRLSFALESRAPVRVVRERGGQYLYGHIASESRVAGAKDFAHAASAQLGEDLVRAYRFANHNQILAWATASHAEARQSVDEASEGGPPAPMDATIS